MLIRVYYEMKRAAGLWRTKTSYLASCLKLKWSICETLCKAYDATLYFSLLSSLLDLNALLNFRLMIMNEYFQYLCCLLFFVEGIHFRFCTNNAYKILQPVLKYRFTNFNYNFFVNYVNVVYQCAYLFWNCCSTVLLVH